VYFYPEEEWGYIPYLFEAFEAGKGEECVLLRVNEKALYGLKKGEEVGAGTAYYFKLYNLPEEMCEVGEPRCARIWEVWCTRRIPPGAVEVVGRPVRPEHRGKLRCVRQKRRERAQPPEDVKPTPPNQRGSRQDATKREAELKRIVKELKGGVFSRLTPPITGLRSECS